MPARQQFAAWGASKQSLAELTGAWVSASSRWQIPDVVATSKLQSALAGVDTQQIVEARGKVQDYANGRVAELTWPQWSTAGEALRADRGVSAEELATLTAQWVLAADTWRTANLVVADRLRQMLLADAVHPQLKLVLSAIESNATTRLAALTFDDYRAMLVSARGESALAGIKNDYELTQVVAGVLQEMDGPLAALALEQLPGHRRAAFGALPFEHFWQVLHREA